MNVSYTAIIIIIVFIVAIVLIIWQGRNIECNKTGPIRENLSPNLFYDKYNRKELNGYTIAPFYQNTTKFKKEKKKDILEKEYAKEDEDENENEEEKDKEEKEKEEKEKEKEEKEKEKIKKKEETQEKDIIEYCFEKVGELNKIDFKNQENFRVKTFDKIYLYKLTNFEDLSKLNLKDNLSLYYIEQPANKDKFPLEYKLYNKNEIKLGMSKSKELFNGDIIGEIFLKELNNYIYEVCLIKFELFHSPYIHQYHYQQFNPMNSGNQSDFNTSPIRHVQPIQPIQHVQSVQPIQSVHQSQVQSPNQNIQHISPTSPISPTSHIQSIPNLSIHNPNYYPQLPQ